MFDKIFSWLSSTLASDREKLLAKAPFFGLTETRIREKVAFGFFLDKANSSLPKSVCNKYAAYAHYFWTYNTNI